MAVLRLPVELIYGRTCCVATNLYFNNMLLLAVGGGGDDSNRQGAEAHRQRLTISIQDTISHVRGAGTPEEG